MIIIEISATAFWVIMALFTINIILAVISIYLRNEERKLRKFLLKLDEHDDI